MAYRITSECVNCGLCPEDCPDGAIVKGKHIYEVVPKRCTDCGICADICPTAACRPVWSTTSVAGVSSC